MNDELREVLQEILDLNFDEKVELGGRALAQLANNLPSYGLNDDEITAFILSTTRLFVSADLECGQSEYDFFRAVTGVNLSVEEFYDMTNQGRDEKFLEDALQVVSQLSGEDRKNMLLYGVALLSCDNVLKVDELKMIDLILNA